MFKWFNARPQLKEQARDLYGAVVAQARTPSFYLHYNVGDTPDGRYELIALHLILTLDRLGQPDVDNEPLRRETLETFITDLDDNMREFGVGVDSVPKRVKRAAGGVYDRGVQYRAALAEPTDDVLATVLTQHVYQGKTTPTAPHLARYVRATVAHLAAQAPSALKTGALTFPNPDQLP
jgi:cytochrome b pre-mRNA-processing protein 3